MCSEKKSKQRNEEAGASLVEYALLVSIILLGVLFSLKVLGFTVHDKIEQAKYELGGGTEATRYYIFECEPGASNCDSQGYRTNSMMTDDGFTSNGQN